MRASQFRPWRQASSTSIHRHHWQQCPPQPPQPPCHVTFTVCGCSLPQFMRLIWTPLGWVLKWIVHNFLKMMPETAPSSSCWVFFRFKPFIGSNFICSAPGQIDHDYRSVRMQTGISPSPSPWSSNFVSARVTQRRFYHESWAWRPEAVTAAFNNGAGWISKYNFNTISCK